MLKYQNHSSDWMRQRKGPCRAFVWRIGLAKHVGRLVLRQGEQELVKGALIARSLAAKLSAHRHCLFLEGQAPLWCSPANNNSFGVVKP